MAAIAETPARISESNPAARCRGTTEPTVAGGRRGLTFRWFDGRGGRLLGAARGGRVADGRRVADGGSGRVADGGSGDW
ncbi:hypothetical protein NCAST_25_03300 [Nocardia asteroides NBRC 15531]|uniref:Uncharacterized protein n=1 Tax=Nocardia asteroides NBRC 15531 TaxID=1110697 RepID=U5E5A1_NOCAS|nr:hypothetical protein NCAST_25_03300 [Nocardia asteroides NBRC 15531]